MSNERPEPIVKIPLPSAPPISEEGAKFIQLATEGNPEKPSKEVLEGKVQDGEFD